MEPNGIFLKTLKTTFLEVKEIRKIMLNRRDGFILKAKK
jgi:hypothetical protein